MLQAVEPAVISAATKAELREGINTLTRKVIDAQKVWLGFGPQISGPGFMPACSAADLACASPQSHVHTNMCQVSCKQ